MNLTQLSIVVDKIYDKVKPSLLNLLPEDVYKVIYDKVKMYGIKDMPFDKSLSEDLICKVKPKRTSIYETPIAIKLGVRSRVLKETNCD